MNELPEDVVRFIYWTVQGDERGSAVGRLRGIKRAAQALYKSYDIEQQYRAFNRRYIAANSNPEAPA